MPMLSKDDVLRMIAPVLQNSTDDDECHATAQALLDTLGTGGTTSGNSWDSFHQSLLTEGEYIYRVDIWAPETGTPLYGHSFAVLQNGWYLHILQAFVSAYSLKTWVEGNAPGADAVYSPSAGGMGIGSKVGAAWIKTLRDSVLGGFAGGAVDLCSAGLGALFGGHAGKRAVVLRGLCKGSSVMGFAWKRRALA